MGLVLTGADLTGGIIHPSGGDSIFTPEFPNKYCLDFDGSNDRLVMSDSTADYERTDAFSFSIWAKIAAGEANADLLMKRTNAGNLEGYTLNVQNGTIFQIILNNNAASRLHVWKTGLSDVRGSWHLFTATYDGSSDWTGVTFYLDGAVLTGYGAPANTLADTILNNADFTIAGAAGFAPAAMRAKDCSVWGKELSASDVTEIWNGGEPGDLAVHSALANLDYWWRMGDHPSDAYDTMHASIGDDTGTMTNMDSGDIVEDSP